jgi:hypothetical protein
VSWQKPGIDYFGFIICLDKIRNTHSARESRHVRILQFIRIIENVCIARQRPRSLIICQGGTIEFSREESKGASAINDMGALVFRLTGVIAKLSYELWQLTRRTGGAKFSEEGEFLPLPSLDTAVVMEVFRRLLLRRLHQAERLSESFMRNLLSWVHPGFSVFAGPPVEGDALSTLEFQARYISRPALALDALQKLNNGRLALETPPDPRTGATFLALDPLEWIHRITAHIPDPGRHCQRFYGTYSNRARAAISSAHDGDAQPVANPNAKQDNADFSREARSTWARLLRKIFEVDPLVCACGARMQIVSLITDPRVVDRILRHRESARCKAKDPFEPRAPPCARARSRQ